MSRSVQAFDRVGHGSTNQSKFVQNCVDRHIWNILEIYCYARYEDAHSCVYVGSNEPNALNYLISDAIK